jgi:hypothetical protein
MELVIGRWKTTDEGNRRRLDSNEPETPGESLREDVKKRQR